MISSETLYWLLSTIPQVLAALVGILAAFVHFCIVRLHELALQKAYVPALNWNIYRFDYLSKNSDKINDKVLKNAVDFKNFLKIHWIFDELKKNYEKHKKTIEKVHNEKRKNEIETELNKEKVILNIHDRLIGH